MALCWTFIGSAVLCYAYAAYVISCAIAHSPMRSQSQNWKSYSLLENGTLHVIVTFARWQQCGVSFTRTRQNPDLSSDAGAAGSLSFHVHI